MGGNKKDQCKLPLLGRHILALALVKESSCYVDVKSKVEKGWVVNNNSLTYLNDVKGLLKDKNLHSLCTWLGKDSKARFKTRLDKDRATWNSFWVIKEIVMKLDDDLFV
mmetsp:Transcript_1098/g.1614  ORF Transcript_1098/g.1614 Transcript_1098/m.1614 type:complete len:109 (-) Transcript_1098:107-433(-)